MSMPKFSRSWRGKPPPILGYGVAVASAAAALLIALWFEPYLVSASRYVFLCAIVLSSWLGGVGPGLLAIGLLILADSYYFEPPSHSFLVSTEYLPRLVLFVVSGVFLGWISVVQRNAGEAFARTNAVLRAEIAERKRAEEALIAENRDRQKAEDALRASEERWRNLFENAPVGIGLLDRQGRFVAANPAYQELVGYSEAELQSLTPADISLEEDRGITKAVMAALAEGQPHVERYERRYRRKDGGLVWVDLSTFLIPVAGSAPLLSGVAVDLTERKRAEEALRNAQAELLRVTRLTTTGELLASIAHEIHQPLSAVATSGSACLRWLDREQPDLAAARGAVLRIVRDAHRAGNVIHGLRAIAQKSGPQLTELDINDAIQEVLTLSRSDLHRHGIVLHTDLTAEMRPVFGDRVQLQQVLLNLITNAVDAMSAVTDRPNVLTIASECAEPDGMLVAVEDTGTGLDPAMVDRLFTPFVTTKANGMGIGLSICRSIIEAHGGHLWVSPRMPCGTVFRFTVPSVPSTESKWKLAQ
jgi:PAS domain S-box-containing protein